jgi:hypothetical protein
MAMSAAIQAGFAAALRDPEHAIPASLTSPRGCSPQRRFAVYRNNIAVSLIDGLRTRFPVTERIVGSEFFSAMARLFIAGHPPRSPLLMNYGDELPDFIADFPPAAELPYLADVARLEAARTRAYHAADVTPLEPRALADLQGSDIARLRVTLHPSCEIVRSCHPIVTIWAMNTGVAPLGPIAHLAGEDALVVRPHLEIEMRTLAGGGAAFLTALGLGAALGAAAAQALAADSRFDLTDNLAALFGCGLVTDFSLAPHMDEQHD